MLICPKCNSALSRQDNTYVCDHKHSFDIAKRGYVNLLLGNHKGSGDDKAMIQARTNFLTSGYYQPLCDELLQILQILQPSVFVDAGSGEGFYTNQIAKALSATKVYGFDLSKAGVDEASKAHTSAFYGVANVFHLPMADHCADVVLSVFAPYDVHEFARILKDGGYFLKVGPGEKHLLELKSIVYENVYENEKSIPLCKPFTLMEEKILEYEIEINQQEDILALYQMTPYYWKSPKLGSERLRATTALKTTVQFHIELYKIAR